MFARRELHNTHLLCSTQCQKWMAGVMLMLWSIEQISDSVRKCYSKTGQMILMSPNIIKTLALRLENRFVWNHPHSLDSRKVAKLWQTEIFKTIFNQTPTLNVRVCAPYLLLFLFGGFVPRAYYE